LKLLSIEVPDSQLLLKAAHPHGPKVYAYLTHCYIYWQG